MPTRKASMRWRRAQVEGEQLLTGAEGEEEDNSTDTDRAGTQPADVSRDSSRPTRGAPVPPLASLSTGLGLGASNG
jgi:hypothetical protein